MKTKLVLCSLLTVTLAAIVSVSVYAQIATPTKMISINGVNIHRQTSASFADWVSSYLETPINITIDESQKDFSLKDLGYFIDMTDVEESFETSTGFQRVLDLMPFNPAPLNVSLKLNTDTKVNTLTDWIDSIDPVREACDAEIAFDAENTGYYVQDHEDSSMDREPLIAYIADQIQNGSDSITVTSSDYRTSADITSQDKELAKYVQAWNQILKPNILDMGGNKTYSIDPEAFHSWLDMDFDTLEFTIDEDAVTALVTKLSKEFNTMGSPISFITNAGSRITVPGGDYGWWLHNAETAEVIQQLLIDPDVFEQEAVWRQKSGNRDGSPVGDSYVEISLSDQHLWMYVDGEQKMDSPIVTGKPSSPTRPGVFGITYKERNGRLRGATYDVQVAYWMPFDGDIGLHDATWQSQFGGKRYTQGYGSHGCVNLPYESAKIIFQNIKAGFPVIVY